MKADGLEIAPDRQHRRFLDAHDVLRALVVLLDPLGDPREQRIDVG